MVIDHFLEAAGGDAMATSIYHIVHPRHDVQVTTCVFYACITGGVVAGSFCQVLVDESLVVAPKSQHERGRKWHLNHNFAKLTCGHFLVSFVHDSHIIAGNRLGDRTG